MGCDPEARSPFIRFPKGQEFIVQHIPDGDSLRQGFIGARMLVRTMTEGIVVGKELPHLAFGHEQVTYDPPLDVTQV